MRHYSIGTGSEGILIIGSCRAVPYLTYLKDWNEQNGNRFTIYFIDPFNWHWDLKNNRVDFDQAITMQESNKHLTGICFPKCKIFIHEYYGNAGMFNTNKDAEKNIYQFGLNPEHDICLPNFNDVFILTREICQFDMECRKMAIQDYNVLGILSQATEMEIEKVREANLNKFYDICSKTSFPEFAQTFKNNYKSKRYFWTFNHVSKEFTQTLFVWICMKLELNLDNYKISQTDLYANNYAHLCEHDKGYTWKNETIKPLREIL